jgi:hypothetical protein
LAHDWEFSFAPHVPSPQKPQSYGQLAAFSATEQNPSPQLNAQSWGQKLDSLTPQKWSPQ